MDDEERGVLSKRTEHELNALQALPVYPVLEEEKSIGSVEKTTKRQ